MHIVMKFWLLLLVSTCGLFAQAQLSIVTGVNPTNSYCADEMTGNLHFIVNGNLVRVSPNGTPGGVTLLQGPFLAGGANGNLVDFFPSEKGVTPLLTCDTIDVWYSMYEHRSGQPDRVWLLFHPNLSVSPAGDTLLAAGSPIGSTGSEKYYLLSVTSLKVTYGRLLAQGSYSTSPTGQIAGRGIFAIAISSVPPPQTLLYKEDKDSPNLMKMESGDISYVWISGSDGNLYTIDTLGKVVVRQTGVSNIHVSAYTAPGASGPHSIAMVAYQKNGEQKLVGINTGGAEQSIPGFIPGGSFLGKPLSPISVLEVSAGDVGVWFDQVIDGISTVCRIMPNAKQGAVQTWQGVGGNMVVANGYDIYTPLADGFYRITGSNVSAPPPPAPPPPVPTVKSVVNAASYETGSAPIGLTTIFGTNLASKELYASALPFPTSLGNVTSVTANGIPCPLVYVNATQINFQLPIEIGVGDATIVVTTNVGSSVPFKFAVSTAQPGMFTDVKGNVMVFDAVTGSPISMQNPAAAGQALTAYGTGFGLVSNPPRNGAPGLAEPFSIVVNDVIVGCSNEAGIPALYAGLVPGFPGLYQVNFTCMSLPASGGQVIQTKVTVKPRTGLPAIFNLPMK